MTWVSPVTNWRSPAYPGPVDFNRIESNILELKKAATIEIVDAGNHFASTNVEGALAELYQMCR